MSTNRYPRYRIRFVAATSVLLGLLASCGTDQLGDGDDPARVVIAQGDDRLPSTTASDWVTYADHVVVVHPVEEQTPDLTASELKRGEGSVVRNVTMAVDEVVWSSPSTSAPKPSGTFTYTAYGYAITDGKSTPMAGDGQPRLELGHSYIMALQWTEARCAEGDRVPGGWRGLGSNSTLPYDDQTVGAGEFEGREVDAAKFKSSLPAGENDLLSASVAGQDVSAVVDKLKSAPVEKREDYLPPPAPCPAS